MNTTCQLEPVSLSPDPLYGRDGVPDADGWQLAVLQPCSRPPGPVQIAPGESEIILDFGTELDAALELEIETSAPVSVAITFGENLWEARDWGLWPTCSAQRPRKQHWHVPAGRQRRQFEAGGFRFARLWFVEVRAPVTIHQIAAHARFWFGARRGDLQCANRRLQRIWQAAAYTARLCTRPDGYWDGIKRDRHGWFGDARITQLATDAVFHDPRPAVRMLAALPVTAWANGIPNYSFDAVAMLRQVVLAYGTETPGVRSAWAQVQTFLEWVRRTQVNTDGELTRRADVAYFFDIGFTDWSPQPLGGRFEELACLQFSWLECLQHAAQLAAWLGGPADYAEHAARLRPRLRQRFAAPGGNFHHTLNLAEPPGTPWRMPLESGVHYRRSYEEHAAFGPSGPSLQAAARAWFAGFTDAPFPTQPLPAIITSYYQHYVLMARAGTGDVTGAFAELERYFGAMLEENDSPTIWEHFEPDVTGMERWSLGSWPRSQCHGWGSCAVPLTQQFLLGVEPVAPGFRQVRLAAAPALPWTFQATVPTPYGPLRVQRAKVAGAVEYEVPTGIEVLRP